MKKEEIALKIAEVGNYYLHAESLMIPILKGFEMREVEDPKVIVFADKDSYCEQLISDGFIVEKDIPKRIQSIIDDTKEFMKEIGCKELKDNFLFHKEYQSDYFHFFVYVQDIVFDDDGEKIIRQMNAYFYEPKMSDFYQLSLSSGPYDLSNTSIRIGSIDLNTDIVTKELESKMNIIMKNLKYND